MNNNNNARDKDYNVLLYSTTHAIFTTAPSTVAFSVTASFVDMFFPPLPSLQPPPQVSAPHERKDKKKSKLGHHMNVRDKNNK